MSNTTVIQIAMMAVILALVIYSAIAVSIPASTGDQQDMQKLVKENQELVEENEDLATFLHGLGKYEAPVFVWQKQVLEPGETSTGILKQKPIERADGTIEDNKAIMVKRGNWDESSSGVVFNEDPNGAQFMIELIIDGKLKGTATGLLLSQGYGDGIWCRDADDNGITAVSKSSNRFNCYFKTTLLENGGVEVLWTMFHPKEMNIRQVMDSSFAEMKNTITELTMKSYESTTINSDLAQYKAPLYVWDKVVLQAGETKSKVIQQKPITLPDGSIETEKAIVTSRGSYVDTKEGAQFVENPKGDHFMIKLLVKEKFEGVAVGKLERGGYGSAIWCGPPISIPDDLPIPDPGPIPNPTLATKTFNCYFRVTLMPDDGVHVLWTMFHPKIYN